MSRTFILMNIKNRTLLVQLINGGTLKDNKLTNGRGQLLYGEPFIMDNRGPNNDEMHVMMSWATNNVSVIGSVEGYIEPDSNKIIVFNKELIPFIQNLIVV